MTQLIRSSVARWLVPLFIVAAGVAGCAKDEAPSQAAAPQVSSTPKPGETTTTPEGTSTYFGEEEAPPVNN
jgi:hypothetical protein